MTDILKDHVEKLNNEAKINPALNQRLQRIFPGYPEQPPFKAEDYEEIQWYHDTEAGFGCWIQNYYTRPMPIPSSIKKAVKYPIDKHEPAYGKVYRSPIPFHAPEVPNSFLAHMVWVIDENGWGQYQYYPRTKDPETGKYMRRYLIIERRMP
jgi:hypothetical protein